MAKKEISNHPCSRSDKIDSMDNDIKTLKKVVLEGNGSESLVIMVSEVRESQNHITNTYGQISEDISDIRTSLGGLFKFRTSVEASERTERRVSEKYIARYRWSTWVLSATIVGLLSALIMLMTMT